MPDQTTAFSEAAAIQATNGFTTCSDSALARLKQMETDIDALMVGYDGRQRRELERTVADLKGKMKVMSGQFSDMAKTLKNTTEGYTGADQRIAQSYNAIGEGGSTAGAMAQGQAGGGDIYNRLNA